MNEDELHVPDGEREPLVEPARDHPRPSVRRGGRRQGITVATACAAATLAVAAVLIGATVTNHPARPGSRLTPPVVTAPPATPPTTPPPGTRYESSLGAQIAVPVGWKVNDLSCHRGDQPSVSRGNGAVEACSTPAPPLKEWARIAPANRAGAQLPKDGLNAREVPIGDIPATRAGGPVDNGMYAGWIAVPSWAVSVTVRARSLDAVNAILDSMSLVTVDAYGCDTPTAATAGGAPENGFIDPAPVSATVCYYGDTTDGRLQASTIRYGQDAVALAAALAATPPGRGPDRSADQCRASAYPVRTNATVILRRADGGSSVIAVSWESCSGAGMSNGRIFHRVDTALIRKIMGGMGLGFMTPVG